MVPKGFSVAYTEAGSPSCVPVNIDSLHLSNVVIDSIISSIRAIIKENNEEITHFEYSSLDATLPDYSGATIKFFKGDNTCVCKSEDIYTLLANTKLIKQKLDKIRCIL